MTTKRTLTEFLASTELHGGKHPLIEVDAAQAGVEHEPFILIRAGRHVAVVRPMKLTSDRTAEDYLDLDIHSFVDGQEATASVFGMTEGVRYPGFAEGTGFTSYDRPSAQMVVVLVGEQKKVEA